MLYYKQTPPYVLKELNSSESGLSAEEAEERLKIYGDNSLKVAGDPLWRKLVEPFANIFMLVLLVAAAISVWQGANLDAIIIIVIMLVSATIYYVQQFSTERILRSLQRHSAQAVEVLRNNKLIKLDSTRLVPGDIIALGEGEKVPADARILSGSGIRVDESLLTGESAAISKQTAALRSDKEVYEQNNMLFQGSFIIAGEVTAVVTATGNTTGYGQLAALSKKVEAISPVQKKIDRLVNHIIAVIAGIAIVAFLLALREGMSMGDSLRFVIALSVSAVPEGLPVAISIVLVLGVRRMAARKALVRNMRAIETIGVITAIATDKTGTLTKNKLTVQETWQPRGHSANLARFAHRVINQTSHKAHDPLDIALVEYVASEGVTPASTAAVYSLPFDQTSTMSGNIWPHGEAYILTIKGAPEHVLLHSSLTEEEREQAEAALHHLTSQGYRVIALADADLAKPVEHFSALPARTIFTFAGFIAIADELRPEAKRSVQAALQAGVTVRMITGDHFETAYHIGNKLGIVAHRDQVFDARRMHLMSDNELDEAITDVRVFSRVIPEDKYRLLSLLKQRHITAMTGDGVNDVPALSNAHVGIAMGSGAQIAKDAGDIILLDDNFKGIIDAMREGRTIIANIRRMLFYLLATSSGEVLTMLGALFIGLPLPLVPVQILWINLVTDTAMVIPLGLEPGEKTNMFRKPKSPNAPIISKFMVSRMLLIALSMAIMTISFYAYFGSRYGYAYGQTIAFSALVVMQWANAFNARSDYESLWLRLRIWNGKFAVGLLVAMTLQFLALFGPLRSLVHISYAAIGDIFITSLLAFIIPIILSEVHKYIGRRYFHK